MQFAKIVFSISLGLFVGGASGALGSWALPVGAVAVLVAACVAAIASEARDYATTGTFDLAAASDPEPLTGELPIAA